MSLLNLTNNTKKKFIKNFTKIIKDKYKRDGATHTDKYETNIEEFNTVVSEDIENDITNGLNNVIRQLHDKNIASKLKCKFNF